MNREEGRRVVEFPSEHDSRTFQTLSGLGNSEHGFWLFVDGKEYFLSYNFSPWFKNARINEISDVNKLHYSILPSLFAPTILPRTCFPNQVPRLHGTGGTGYEVFANKFAQTFHYSILICTHYTDELKAFIIIFY